MTPAKSLHEIALTARESHDNLSALSKHAYGQLFTWIVGFINRCHLRDVHDLNSKSSSNGNNVEGKQKHVEILCAQNFAGVLRNVRTIHVRR